MSGWTQLSWPAHLSYNKVVSVLVFSCSRCRNRNVPILTHFINYRTNLTASGPRPNPQGSYHYGMINTSRTIILQSSSGQVNGKQRYGINSVSFTPADTPLKLADYFNIGGVFRVGSISDRPTGGGLYQDTSVMGADYRAFVEIVFENPSDIVLTYHLDGYQFFVVG